MSHTPNGHSVSRRGFLKAAGASAGLVVAWSSSSILQNAAAAPATPVATAPPAPARRTQPTDVDSYLRVNEDGSVTVCTGKVEFGQGIQTGYMQLVAEELDVALDQVEVIMGITDQVPYDGATVGSGSTRRTGPILRGAAAEMRQWLLELGAEQLGVAVADVSTRDGAVVVTSAPDQTVTFAALAAGKQSVREISETVQLKDPADYTVVGQDIPRVDVPFKVNGAMKYGYDAAIEGMVHAKVIRPPALGATLQDIDFSAAESMPGVVGSFRDGDFAALAAERRDQVEAAAAAVVATWSEVNTGNTSENIYDLLVSTADEGEVLDEEPGDADSGLASADKTLSTTYRAPYVSHSPLEPKTALVDVQPDSVTVWTSTQAPFGVQQSVAELLGRPLESVVVNPLMSGGAFGSKSYAMAELEAARISQALGRPVKIQWSRQEEFQFGRFRPAAHIEINAGLDANGNVTGWSYDLYSSGYFPEGAEEPTRCAANASANAADVYGLTNARTTWYQGDSPLPPHFWRGNGTSYNVFAYEGAIDQLAELAGQDPVTFRAGLLQNNPRMLAVMNAVVEKAGWTPGVGSTGQGFGIAMVYADDTYVAQVAQVEVDTTTGQIKVLHIDAATDCGLVVNPMAASHQTEGAIIYSLSPVLREAVTFDNGTVTNASWGQYRPITMSEIPSIDSIFVEDKSQPMGGIGEPAVAPVPGAVANAVYDAIGVRLTELPFTPDRVLAAINEQAKARPTLAVR